MYATSIAKSFITRDAGLHRAKQNKQNKTMRVFCVMLARSVTETINRNSLKADIYMTGIFIYCLFAVL